MRSRREALETLLGYDVVPGGYRDDIVTCLGLSGGRTAASVYASACRLSRGVLQLLEAHESTFVGPAPQDAASLRDGGLRRCIEHAIGRQ